jgi:chondroitin AC lyase
MSSKRILLGIAVCLFAAASVRADADLDRVTRQYQDFVIAQGPGGEGGATKVVRSLGADGSWTDVDYKDATRGGWRTYDHLDRVLAMVKAYRSPNTGPEAKAELRAAIHRALGYWLRNDFQNPNWWYNNIGVPQDIADIAILIRDELSPEELDVMANRILPRAKIGMTGENRVWLAGITLVRGLLLKDRTIVEEAAGVIGEEIHITTSEGMQPDFSFHQHGPQQQFGNYGLSFANNGALWTLVLRGTPFEFSREKIALLHDYLLRGESWVVWRGEMDLSSCGRQLGPGCQEDKGRALARAMQIMSEADAARAGDYEAFLKRNDATGVNDLTGNKDFWRSDYMIERGAEYYASVKMSSRRVIGAELVNSENVSGLHLGDGALYLYRTGAEYRNIQPAWDWQKLPGTTCAQFATWPVKYSHSQVESDFVGGVSDGRAGCAAMDYTRDGVSARKAWFFVDGAVACLGTGIRGTGAEPVVTTIDQRWLKGEVMAGSAQSVRRLPDGENELTGPGWLWHDGVGYVFPGGSEIRVRLGEQHGSWRKVDDKSIVPPREISGDVLLITREHGVRPQNQAYAYVMFPCQQAAEMNARTEAPAVVLLRNIPALQAVRSADGGRMEAVFHEPGGIEYAPGKTVAVSQPCLLMVDSSGGRAQVTVADPTQKLESLDVTVEGVRHAVPLPRGGEAGKSVRVE